MLAVRLIRLANDLTLHEVGRLTGIAASRLSLIERGLEAASDEELTKISSALPKIPGQPRSLMAPVDLKRLVEAIR
jgi:transcriptional regulator with XRE-family HTH domain